MKQIFEIKIEDEKVDTSIPERAIRAMMRALLEIYHLEDWSLRVKEIK